MENNDFRDDPSLRIKSLRRYKVNLVRGSRAKLPDQGEYFFELVTTQHGNMLILHSQALMCAVPEHIKMNVIPNLEFCAFIKLASFFENECILTTTSASSTRSSQH